jgi:hypothetical protein
MPAAISRHLELRLRLCAANLTGGALVPRLVLSLLGRREHFARCRHSGFAFGDPGPDLTRAAGERVQPRDRQAFTLTQPLNQRACFGRFPSGTLVLSGQGGGSICRLDIRPRGLGCCLPCDNCRALR